MKNYEYKYMGWLRVLALVIPYMVTVGIFQLIGYFVTGVDLYPLDLTKTAEQHAIISFFSFIGTLLVIWIFTRFWDKEKFIDLGIAQEWMPIIRKAGFQTVAALKEEKSTKLHQDICGWNKKLKMGLKNPSQDEVLAWLS